MKFLFLLLSISISLTFVNAVCRNTNIIPQRISNDNCGWYNDLTCCNQSAVSSYSDARLSTQCTSAARSCKQLLVQLLCGLECAPAYSSWLDNTTGKVRVCSSFADSLYFECKDSQFQNRNAVGQFSFSTCDTIKDRYSDSLDLITNGFDMAYADGVSRCFNGSSILYVNLFLLLLALTFVF